jgi:hypothetical protein
MQDEQATQGHPAAPAYPPPAPVPGPVPVPAAPAHPATGESRVDAALAGLSQLSALPVAEHPAVFEQVHRQLREVLGELDSGAANPGAAGHHGRPGR